MSKKQTLIVSGEDGKAIVDKAIRIPSLLTSEDGRHFHVTKWAPLIEYGSIVTIELTVNVAIPVDADAH